MATTTITTAFPNIPDNADLRTRLEELLFDFYSIVGIAPQRSYAVIANDLLTDNFQGRFFIEATSELLCFNKTQMLASHAARPTQQPPVCQLITMTSAKGTDGNIHASYAVSFRYGQTAMLRRGTLNVIETDTSLALVSIDEDVRIVELSKTVAKKSVAFDRPRIWIV
jgi:hypothetical protein